MRKHPLVLACVAICVAPAALAQDHPGDGTTVRPVVGNIKEELFQSRILFRALEDLGYTVAPPLVAEVQDANMAIGNGEADFYPIHWGNLQASFFEEAGGDDVLERVGPFVEGMLQGYLVDSASFDAGVTSLADLSDPELAARFDTDGDGTADLTGCIVGWGCARVIDHHLSEYGLSNTVTHQQAPYDDQIRDVIARQRAGQPVLYYTWTPYWVSGELVPGADVKWLSVPYTSLPGNVTASTEYEGRNMGFAVDAMYILTRDDFLAANPPIAALFDAAELDVNTISAQNLLMANGSEDIDAHVDTWIASNQDSYDSWLQAARSAAN